MSSLNEWLTVCKLDDLVENSGVCALVEDVQVALFKLSSANDETVIAISNWDPIGKANVLYRGLLGNVEEKKVVVSPLYKQRYCLDSGLCIDDEQYRLEVFETRIVEHQVQLKRVG